MISWRYTASWLIYGYARRAQPLPTPFFKLLLIVLIGKNVLNVQKNNLFSCHEMHLKMLFEQLVTLFRPLWINFLSACISPWWIIPDFSLSSWQANNQWQILLDVISVYTQSISIPHKHGLFYKSFDSSRWPSGFIYLHGLTSIPPWISNHMPNKGGIKLFIHSQTSTVALLKFEDGKVILSHTL